MVSTSSKADTSTTVDDWFDNVENIKPLRGGRKGDTLNEVSRCTNKYSAEQAEEKFRLVVQTITLYNSMILERSWKTHVKLKMIRCR